MNCSKIYVVIVALSLWFVSSCSSDDEEVYLFPDSLSDFEADLAVRISVQDTYGNDLLDPQYENSYKAEDIRTAALIEIEDDSFYGSGLYWTCNYEIFKFEDEGKYYIELIPSRSWFEKYTVTYIDWGNNDMDTLKCKIIETADLRVCTQVWYNKEMKYNKFSSSSRSFVIVK
ncbi:hypothetical protein LVD15_00880 [Fulvivirga maritima]|uniref:hypothetical protein n=1 Tax=Fulvivirga maritima TaxID=2904247 RepID=UPI001F402C67|nr:hypothetical protein [Fulvivirga maritima]UII27023.1 hypothetical protein LVD15_00880 [Fulvivirga maritima]